MLSAPGSSASAGGGVAGLAVAPAAAVAASAEVSTLLTSLAESAQFGPAIKLIHERNYFDSFSSTLQQSISVKDGRIREICHAHYLDFLQSIDHLMAVKGEMEELRAQLRGLNGDVQSSAQQLVKAASAVNEQRRQRLQLNDARETLRQGQQLLELTAKLTQQIHRHKFFAAVKSLDQLQQLHLPRFADHDFAKQLELELPFLIERIKVAVRSEFYRWLQSTIARSSQLGQAALTHTHNRLQRVEQRRGRQRQRLQLLQGADSSQWQQNSGSGSIDGSSSSSALLAFANDDADEEDEGLLDAVAINFAPVYRCLHIYAALSQQQRFAALYKKKRRANLIHAMELPAPARSTGKTDAAAAAAGSASPAASASPSLLESNLSYFSGIAGFFVLEDRIMKGDNELMSRAEVDGLFELAAQKVRSVVKAQLAAVTGVRDFLAVKSSVVVLLRTMEACGYRTAALLELLKGSRERFEQLISARFAWEVKSLLKQERWQPLDLARAEEYRQKVLQYQLGPPLPADAAFPMSVPFSASLPALCQALAALIDDYYQFSQGVDDSHTPMLRAVDAALLEQVNAAMAALIDSKQVQVSAAVQLAINAASMIDVCAFLEHRLSTYASASHSSARPVYLHDIGSPSVSPSSGSSLSLPAVAAPRLHLTARSSFQQTRIRCEDVLFELIDSKIDQFLQSGLQSPELLPTAIALEPSDYVTELTSYLDSTFASLQHISASVREAVYFTSTRHIASSLSQYLLSTCRRLNLIAAHNLSSDLHLLENFARRQPVSGLAECYSECRQLLNLLLSGETDDLADEARRSKLYPHLSLTKIVKMLDKVKELPAMGAGKLPDSLSRVKRRHIDAVIKKLQMQMPK